VVDRPYGVARSPRHDLEDAVTDGMTVSVVDPLEAVEVDEQQPDAGTG
jgi:hypothetical protein